MKRILKPVSAQGPLSKKILSQMQKISTSKVIDLKQFKAGRENAENL